jgi:integrase/recombinase XerD
MVYLYANRMQMEKSFISIYHDTRRTKENGKYPVKLRVFISNPRKQKFYPLNFEYTKEEFKSIYETERPRRANLEERTRLKHIESKANEVAMQISPFSFEQFERLFFRKAGEGISLAYLYETQIAKYQKSLQLNTADSYKLAEKSIQKYFESCTRKKYKSVTLYDISPEMLRAYEKFMISDTGRSKTTVGIYLRTLRALFNLAISEKEIEQDYYPFGRRKYQIPTAQNVKKALSKPDLGHLMGLEPKTPQQQKAKDFWFFSYSCNGMNIKDIALLRNKDISEGTINFYRAKTNLTARNGMKPIVAVLTDFTKKVIENYRIDGNGDDFVFDIVSKQMTPEQQQKAIKNFTRYINQNLDSLCRANNFPHKVSTYWARHSFASNYVAAGANVIDAMESLGHSSIQTTQSYLRSFDGETKKKLAESLMDF